MKQPPLSLSLKTISLTLVLCLLGESLLFAAGDSRGTIELPKTMALTQPLQKAGDRMLVHVQDAHESLSAQENISRVLERLVQNYDLKLIALEGGQGSVGTDFVRAFPVTESKQKLGRYLLKEGRIGGGEYYSMISPEDVVFFGAEDKELYDEDRRLFSALQSRKSRYEKLTQLLTDAIRDAEVRYLVQAHRQFRKTSADFKENRLSFSEYWEYLKKNHARQLSRHAGETSSLREIHKIFNLERHIDFRKAGEEREELMAQLGSGSDAVSQEALRLLMDFKSDKLDKTVFCKLLLEQAKKNLPIRGLYRHFRRYVLYLSLFESSNPLSTVYALDALNEKIEADLAKEGSYADFYEFDRNMAVFLKMLRLDASGNDFEWFKKNRAFYELPNLKAFVTRFLKDVPSLSGDFEAYASDAVRFYDLADQRNDAFVRNTLARMQKENLHNAVLITGGFHSQGIARILKESRISYLSVVPSMKESNDKRPYVAVLTERPGQFASEGNSQAAASTVSAPIFLGQNSEPAKGAVLAGLLAMEAVQKNGGLSVPAQVLSEYRTSLGELKDPELQGEVLTRLDHFSVKETTGGVRVSFGRTPSAGPTAYEVAFSEKGDIGSIRRVEAESEADVNQAEPASLSPFAQAYFYSQDSPSWRSAALHAALSIVVAQTAGAAGARLCGPSFSSQLRDEEDSQKRIRTPKQRKTIWTQLMLAKRRGGQSGGGAVMAIDTKTGSFVIVYGKKKKGKRRNSVEVVDAEMERVLRQAQKQGLIGLPDYDVEMDHLRYATVGESTWDNAQPHFHESPELTEVFSVGHMSGETSLAFQTRIVFNMVQHNGDFDEWTSAWLVDNVHKDVTLAQKELRVLLKKIIPKSKSKATSDSKSFAEIVDFELTQGQVRKSARYAWARGLDLREISEKWNDDKLDQIADVLTGVVKGVGTQLGDEFYNPNATTLKDVSEAAKDLIKKKMVKELTKRFGKWDPDSREAFVDSFLQAFFYQDLTWVMRHVSHSFKGTAALNVLTTLEPRWGIFAKTQTFSVGYNGRHTLGGAEPETVTVPLMQSGLASSKQMFVPDGYYGTVEHDPKAKSPLLLYPPATSYNDLNQPAEPISEEEMHFFPVIGNPKVQVFADEIPEELSGAKNKRDMDDIPAAFVRVEESFKNGGENEASLDHLVDLVSKKAKKWNAIHAGGGDPDDVLQSGKYDLILHGVDFNLDLAQRFAEELEEVAPYFNVKVLDSGELEDLVKRHERGRDTKIKPDTIIIGLSNLGQTQGVLEATRRLHKMQKKGHVFAVTQKLFNAMSQSLGQSFRPEDPILPVTFQNMSHLRADGSITTRDSEASSITTAATEAVLTEILVGLTQSLIRLGEETGTRPFGMDKDLRTQDVEIFREHQKVHYEVQIPNRMGVDVHGEPINSPDEETIQKEADYRARNVSDWLKSYLIHAFYIAVLACFFNLPLFGTIDWLFGGVLNIYVLRSLEAAYYLSGGWLWIMAIRWWEGRPISGRMGPRVEVFVDKVHYGRILERYNSAFFSTAPGFVSVLFYHAHLIKDVLHRYALRAARGDTFRFHGPNETDSTEEAIHADSMNTASGQVSYATFKSGFAFKGEPHTHRTLTEGSVYDRKNTRKGHHDMVLSDATAALRKKYHGQISEVGQYLIARRLSDVSNYLLPELRIGYLRAQRVANFFRNGVYFFLPPSVLGEKPAEAVIWFLSKIGLSWFKELWRLGASASEVLTSSTSHPVNPQNPGSDPRRMLSRREVKKAQLDQVRQNILVLVGSDKIDEVMARLEASARRIVQIAEKKYDLQIQNIKQKLKSEKEKVRESYSTQMEAVKKLPKNRQSEFMDKLRKILREVLEAGKSDAEREAAEANAVLERAKEEAFVKATEFIKLSRASLDNNHLVIDFSYDEGRDLVPEVPEQSAGTAYDWILRLTPAVVNGEKVFATPNHEVIARVNANQQLVEIQMSFRRSAAPEVLPLIHLNGNGKAGHAHASSSIKAEAEEGEGGKDFRVEFSAHEGVVAELFISRDGRQYYLKRAPEELEDQIIFYDEKEGLTASLEVRGGSDVLVISDVVSGEDLVYPLEDNEALLIRGGAPSGARLASENDPEKPRKKRDFYFEPTSEKSKKLSQKMKAAADSGLFKKASEEKVPAVPQVPDPNPSDEVAIDFDAALSEEPSDLEKLFSAASPSPSSGPVPAEPSSSSNPSDGSSIHSDSPLSDGSGDESSIFSDPAPTPNSSDTPKTGDPSDVSLPPGTPAASSTPSPGSTVIRASNKKRDYYSEPTSEKSKKLSQKMKAAADSGLFKKASEEKVPAVPQVPDLNSSDKASIHSDAAIQNESEDEVVSFEDSTPTLPTLKSAAAVESDDSSSVSFPPAASPADPIPAPQITADNPAPEKAATNKPKRRDYYFEPTSEKSKKLSQEMKAAAESGLFKKPAAPKTLQVTLRRIDAEGGSKTGLALILPEDGDEGDDFMNLNSVLSYDSEGKYFYNPDRALKLVSMDEVEDQVDFKRRDDGAYEAFGGQVIGRIVGEEGDERFQFSVVPGSSSVFLLENGEVISSRIVPVNGQPVVRDPVLSLPVNNSKYNELKRSEDGTSIQFSLARSRYRVLVKRDEKLLQIHKKVEQARAAKSSKPVYRVYATAVLNAEKREMLRQALKRPTDGVNGPAKTAEFVMTLTPSFNRVRTERTAGLGEALSPSKVKEAVEEPAKAKNDAKDAKAAKGETRTPAKAKKKAEVEARTLRAAAKAMELAEAPFRKQAPLSPASIWLFRKFQALMRFMIVFGSLSLGGVLLSAYLAHSKFLKILSNKTEVFQRIESPEPPFSVRMWEPFFSPENRKIAVKPQESTAVTMQESQPAESWYPVKPIIEPVITKAKDKPLSDPKLTFEGLPQPAIRETKEAGNKKNLADAKIKPDTSEPKTSQAVTMHEPMPVPPSKPSPSTAPVERPIAPVAPVVTAPVVPAPPVVAARSVAGTPRSAVPTPKSVLTESDAEKSKKKEEADRQLRAQTEAKLLKSRLADLHEKKMSKATAMTALKDKEGRARTESLNKIAELQKNKAEVEARIEKEKARYAQIQSQIEKKTDESVRRQSAARQQLQKTLETRVKSFEKFQASFGILHDSKSGEYRVIEEASQLSEILSSEKLQENGGLLTVGNQELRLSGKGVEWTWTHGIPALKKIKLDKKSSLGVYFSERYRQILNHPSTVHPEYLEALTGLGALFPAGVHKADMASPGDPGIQWKALQQKDLSKVRTLGQLFNELTPQERKDAGINIFEGDPSRIAVRTRPGEGVVYRAHELVLFDKSGKHRLNGNPVHVYRALPGQGLWDNPSKIQSPAIERIGKKTSRFEKLQKSGIEFLKQRAKDADAKTLNSAELDDSKKLQMDVAEMGHKQRLETLEAQKTAYDDAISKAGDLKPSQEINRLQQELGGIEKEIREVEQRLSAEGAGARLAVAGPAIKVGVIVPSGVSRAAFEKRFYGSLQAAGIPVDRFEFFFTSSKGTPEQIVRRLSGKGVALIVDGDSENLNNLTFEMVRRLSDKLGPLASALSSLFLGEVRELSPAERSELIRFIQTTLPQLSAVSYADLVAPAGESALADRVDERVAAALREPDPKLLDLRDPQNPLVDLQRFLAGTGTVEKINPFLAAAQRTRYAMADPSYAVDFAPILTRSALEPITAVVDLAVFLQDGAGRPFAYRMDAIEQKLNGAVNYKLWVRDASIRTIEQLHGQYPETARFGRNVVFDSTTEDVDGFLALYVGQDAGTNTVFLTPQFTPLRPSQTADGQKSLVVALDQGSALTDKGSPTTIGFLETAILLAADPEEIPNFIKKLSDGRYLFKLPKAAPLTYLRELQRSMQLAGSSV